MMQLYQLLLLLYPSAFRREFADEMIVVFRQRQRDYESRNLAARLAFSFREIAGLVAGALGEHMKVYKRTPTHRAARSFRFPAWAIVSMVVALLFVLTLIQSVVFLISQRMAIRTDALPPWRFLVLDFVFFAVVTMCFLGLIGFGLRVVSGRTGIQRLADINTRPAARGPFR